jgi:hypothetical protein
MGKCCTQGREHLVRRLCDPTPAETTNGINVAGAWRRPFSFSALVMLANASAFARLDFPFCPKDTEQVTRLGWDVLAAVGLGLMAAWTAARGCADSPWRSRQSSAASAARRCARAPSGRAASAFPSACASRSSRTERGPLVTSLMGARAPCSRSCSPSPPALESAASPGRLRCASRRSRWRYRERRSRRRHPHESRSLPSQWSRRAARPRTTSAACACSPWTTPPPICASRRSR